MGEQRQGVLARGAERIAYLGDGYPFRMLTKEASDCLRRLVQRAR
jgi:hypothetical protein